LFVGARLLFGGARLLFAPYTQVYVLGRDSVAPKESRLMFGGCRLLLAPYTRVWNHVGSTDHNAVTDPRGSPPIWYDPRGSPPIWYDPREGLSLGAVVRGGPETVVRGAPAYG